MGNSKKIDNSYVQKIYDLKGSIVKRIVPEEVDNEYTHKNTAVLKDVNILNLQKKLNVLKFRPEDIKQIIEQLSIDIYLLSKFELMDYSLLFCLAFNPKYIEMYPEEFKSDPVTGELIKPYQLKQREYVP